MIFFIPAQKFTILAGAQQIYWLLTLSADIDLLQIHWYQRSAICINIKTVFHGWKKCLDRWFKKIITQVDQPMVVCYLIISELFTVHSTDVCNKVSWNLRYPAFITYLCHKYLIATFSIGWYVRYRTFSCFLILVSASAPEIPYWLSPNLIHHIMISKIFPSEMVIVSVSNIPYRLDSPELIDASGLSWFNVWMPSLNWL